MIPLGILGAIITLGLIVWIYLNIRDANREAVQLDNKILANLSAVSLVVERIETDFRDIFEGKSYSQEGDELAQLLEIEFESLQRTLRQISSVESQSQVVDSGYLANLRDSGTSWRQDNELLVSKHQQAKANVVASIGRLRGQMDSVLGRKRIQSILIAKKLRQHDSKNHEQLVDTFLNESKFGSALSMSKTELSDLEIMCIKLANEPKIDLLDSILQNEIVPSIDQLDQQIAVFEDPELTESFELVKRSITGTASSTDHPIQNQHDAQPGGLYQLKYKVLKSELQGHALQEEVEKALISMASLVDYQVESAKSLRDRVAGVTSKSLKTGGITIVLASVLIGIAYGLLVYKIAHSVQRFVHELRESHEALRVANSQAVKANTKLQDSINERDLLQGQLLEAQKLESIGQLAAGIAHEINTPTQFVGDNVRFLQAEFKGVLKLLDHCARQLDTDATPQGWEERSQKIVQALEEMDYEFLRDEIPQALDQSIDGIDRIAKIVNAMKEFSHPGSSVMDPADINSAIKSTTVVCSNRWKYAAEIKFDLDEDVGLVPCMLGEFNQVILNLVVNAADAIESMNNGTGEKGLIQISTQRHGDSVSICVEDNGGGMPESVRTKIFDPFYTTKEVGKGTGQGLAISWDVIVNKHSGSIVCETDDGVGTKFIIQLPLLQDIDEDETQLSSAA